jgi:hypothetical protein
MQTFKGLVAATCQLHSCTLQLSEYACRILRRLRGASIAEVLGANTADAL